MALIYRVAIDDAGSKLVRRVFEELAKVPTLAMNRVLGLTAQYIIRLAKRLIRARAHDWGPSHGNLGKSLTTVIDSMSVTVGSNLKYAAIQQLGGVIKPTGGRKYLAIPVASNMRGKYPSELSHGLMIYKPAESIRIGSHSWTGPALVRAESEVRVGKNGKSRTVKKAGEVMFALVKRATIKGREYLVFDNGARAFLFDETRRAYTRVTGQAR